MDLSYRIAGPRQRQQMRRFPFIYVISVFSIFALADVEFFVETSDIIENTLWKADLNPFVYHSMRWTGVEYTQTHAEYIDVEVETLNAYMRFSFFSIFESINDDSLSV